MPLEIVLARHGETEWSRDGRHTGRTDISLTEEGRREALLVRDALAEWSFVEVLSGPLGRALETCRLAGLGDTAEITDDLLEWDYGDYEGLTSAEIRRDRPDWDLWRDGCPGGESPDDVAERADRVIARALALSGDLCVVAHSHLLRMLATRWLEQPHAFGARLPLGTATISELGVDRELRALVSWSSA